VAQTQDEGFHEIQLNGKQLVFLFIGGDGRLRRHLPVRRARWARRARGAQCIGRTDIDSVGRERAAAASRRTVNRPLPESDPTKAAPPPPADDLTYFNRLEKPNAGPEKLKGATEKPAPAPATVSCRSCAAAGAQPTTAPPKSAPAPVEAKVTPAPPPPAPVTPAPKATSASNEPSGSGFVVQIAALKVRGDAEAIAKQLSAKGYAAYVLTAAGGNAARVPRSHRQVRDPS